jgi:hypothetical protein
MNRYYYALLSVYISLIYGIALTTVVDVTLYITDEMNMKGLFFYRRANLSSFISLLLYSVCFKKIRWWVVENKYYGRFNWKCSPLCFFLI